MATGGAAGALRRFELDGVHDTSREVGHGSYAVVKELEYHGLKCVGKKIHGILFESATPHEKASMLERFAGECELLGGLHHPCIVQFLGVWFEQGSQLPILVMEYLHTTLSACLEKYGVLPKMISYGILRDVALGLRYLHERSPPIIHRDLSANNVLLTSNMNAKLSDLGVAKILNLTATQMTQMTQTKAPGTPCYMPPEAMVDHPKYTSKIDIYSYGVLIIHILCGRWPFPGGVFRPHPLNPGTMIPISEVERRAEYLQEIGNDHPLMAQIHQCLSNAPARRPEASTLLNQVNTILSAFPQQFTNRVEMLQTFEKCIESKSEIESLRAEVERLSLQSLIRHIHSRPSHITESGIKTQPHLFHPQAKLQWKRCADMPVGMVGPQAVVMGEKVYIGGGISECSEEECNQVLQYDPSRDEWSRLPPLKVIAFFMAQFKGNLITVGGLIPHVGLTGKVYRFKEQSQKWEEFLTPMPTARVQFTVATTQSAIVASGGYTGARDGEAVLCATVEVYSSETFQWHTADPLPVPCLGMTSVTIADTWYQLGGVGTDDKSITTVLYAPLATLIQKATSPTHQSASHMTVWKTLPDTPLIQSAAASLSGNLLAVGGGDYETGFLSAGSLTFFRSLFFTVGTHPSPAKQSRAVHVFLPLTNSWVRVMTGDLPEPCWACTAVQLSSNQVLMFGGADNQKKPTKTVFLGSITL